MYVIIYIIFFFFLLLTLSYFSNFFLPSFTSFFFFHWAIFLFFFIMSFLFYFLLQSSFFLSFSLLYLFLLSLVKKRKRKKNVLKPWHVINSSPLLPMLPDLLLSLHSHQQLAHIPQVTFVITTQDFLQESCSADYFTNDVASSANAVWREDHLNLHLDINYWTLVIVWHDIFSHD